MALPHLVLLAFQLAGVAIPFLRGTAGSNANAFWILATAVVTLGISAASQIATLSAGFHVYLEWHVTLIESFVMLKGRICSRAASMLGKGIAVAIGFRL